MLSGVWKDAAKPKPQRAPDPNPGPPDLGRPRCAQRAACVAKAAINNEAAGSPTTLSGIFVKSPSEILNKPRTD